MKTTLIYQHYPTTTKTNNTSIIEQMSILNELAPYRKFVFVTKNKSPKGAKYIEDLVGIHFDKVISASSSYDDEIRSKRFSGWQDFMESSETYIDNHPDLKDLEISEIFMFGSLMTGQSNKKNTEYFTNILEKNRKDGMSWISIGTRLHVIFSILKIALKKKCPVYTIYFDPYECVLNDIEGKYSIDGLSFFGYTISDKIKRLDTLQFFCEESKKNKFDTERKKDLHFVFGVTCCYEERVEEFKKFQVLLKSDWREIDTKFFIKDYFVDPQDTLISRSEYLKYIERAKYTLVMPSINVDAFSILRLIESLDLDTIPFISDTCKMNGILDEFGISEEIWNKIYLPYDKIAQASYSMEESERLEILKHLKEKILKPTVTLKDYMKIK